MRDVENSFLSLDSADASGFDDLLGHSITHRIALGPHQGRKAFTLQTVPAVAAADDNSSLAKAAGLLRVSCPSPFALRASLRLFKIAPGDFVSLHAGVASEADEREKLERLCRYITRPAVSTERLSLTAQWCRQGGRSCASCARGIRASLHSIASIEDPVAIKKILAHLARRAEAAMPAFRPFARAPPQQQLPGLTQPG